MLLAALLLAQAAVAGPCQIDSSVDASQDDVMATATRFVELIRTRRFGDAADMLTDSAQADTLYNARGAMLDAARDPDAMPDFTVLDSKSSAGGALFQVRQEGNANFIVVLVDRNCVVALYSFE
ncbi:MAG: hypothetical protein ACOY45_04660 [Pseudomonadota bacterium]